MLGAIVLIPLLRRVRLPTEGLYPVLALVLAGALYGATSLAHGSGFLAVFIMGIAFGDVRTPYKGEIERFSGSLASLAELAVFVALGLTIDLGGLSGEIWLDGIVLVLVLALVARPLVVLLTLGLARLSWAERGFIAWSGLKGAVPILLAAFAVLESVSGADKVYGLVFVVVLALGRDPGNARAVRRPGARDPDARAAGIAVGAVGQARRGAARRARVRGRRQLHARWAARSATFRSASTPGSRSSCGTAPRPGPAARSSSRPAIASCSSPTPASSKRWRDSSTVHDSPTPRGRGRHREQAPGAGPNSFRQLTASPATVAGEPSTAPTASSRPSSPTLQPKICRASASSA